MSEDQVEFAKGARCELNQLGIERHPRTDLRAGTVIGKASTPNTLRVLFDGSKTPVSLHRKYIQLLVSPEMKHSTSKKPRSLADKPSRRRDHVKIGMREKLTLPLDAARIKARRTLDQKHRDYTTIIERWTALPDGNIELTLVRVPSPKP